MDIHFSCTVCGKCCHDLKLPLTIAEASRWLVDGNDVQVLCEAVPWYMEPPPSDLQAAHRRRRSFAAVSGTMPTRVIVILAATFSGACPYLQPNMQCGMYPHRPLVCRIYPAEVNPFIELKPAHKACPAEAWTPDRPLFQRDGRLVDLDLQRLIQESRDTDAREAGARSRLCGALHLDRAAMAGEGFVAHSPDRGALLLELQRADVAEDSAAGSATSWRFISNQAATIDALRPLGAAADLFRPEEPAAFEYLPLKPAAAARNSAGPGT